MCAIPSISPFSGKKQSHGTQKLSSDDQKSPSGEKKKPDAANASLSSQQKSPAISSYPYESIVLSSPESREYVKLTIQALEKGGNTKAADKIRWQMPPDPKKVVMIDIPKDEVIKDALKEMGKRDPAGAKELWDKRQKALEADPFALY